MESCYVERLDIYSNLAIELGCCFEKRDLTKFNFVLLQGIQLVWESYKLEQYVHRFAELVCVFQEKVEDLLVVEEQLDVDVRSLETCPYSAQTLGDILAKIQHSVDDLSLKQYSNLHIWVTRLDLAVSIATFLTFSSYFDILNCGSQADSMHFGR